MREHVPGPAAHGAAVKRAHRYTLKELAYDPAGVYRYTVREVVPGPAWSSYPCTTYDGQLTNGNSA